MKNQNRPVTVCYFGNFSPKFSRNAVYIRGLRENGARVIECRDGGEGPLKFWRLIRKHASLIEKYDALVVGYPGHIFVPLAKLIARAPVVFDALCTAWEAEAFSHRVGKRLELKFKIIDRIAVWCADTVLVETEEQRKFFIERFGGRPEKYIVAYTGVDDSVFCPDASVPKLPSFTVLFRGRLTPEAGVKYVLKAAEILKSEEIYWKIVGFGQMEREVKRDLTEMNLKKVELISRELPAGELARSMRECHVSLGQFEKNERLKRTIPHKAFESIAVGIPYVTARAEGISEILTDGENCLMVNKADPEDLAEKILRVKNDPALGRKIAENGQALYLSKFTPALLGKKILGALRSL